MMSQSLQFSINQQRLKIAQNLIKYSTETFFSLVIREKDMMNLIYMKMYYIIEDLINSNSFLKIDSANLSK